MSTLAELLALYRDASEVEEMAKRDRLVIRREIDAVLRDEYERTGTLPTHRLAGVGTAYLSGGGPKVSVIQPQAYADWVAERWPEAVSLVITVPYKHVHADDFQRAWGRVQLLATETSSRVDPATLGTITANGSTDAETGQLVTEDGEVVDGVRVSATEPGLWVKPAKAPTTEETNE